MTRDLPRIYGIVERWLAEAPERGALTFGDEEWTWGQQDGRIRRAAAAVRTSGMQAGVRIAIVDKNHPACLKLTQTAPLIGAASAVVDFRLAPDDLAYMLDDSGAAVTVVGAEFADHVAGLRHRLPALRREPWLAGAAPRADAEIVEAIANCFPHL